MALSLALAPLSTAQPQEAISLYRQKEFAQAHQVLEPYLKSHPGDFQACLLLGLCYQGAGDRESAERVFQAAVEHGPDDHAARFYLARIEQLRA